MQMQNRHGPNDNLAVAKVTQKQGPFASMECQSETRQHNNNNMVSTIINDKMQRSHHKVVGDVSTEEFNAHDRWTILPTTTTHHLHLAPRINIWFAFAVSSCVAVVSIGQAKRMYAKGNDNGVTYTATASNNFALSACVVSFVFSLLISTGMYYVPLRTVLTKTLVYPFGLGRVCICDLRLTIELVVLSLLVILWLPAIVIIMNGGVYYSASRGVTLAMAGSNIWNANVFYSSWTSFLLSVYLWVEVFTLTDRRGTLEIDSVGSHSHKGNGQQSPSHGRAENTFTKRWTLLFFHSSMCISASIEKYLSASCQGQVLKQSSYCRHALSGIIMGGAFQIVLVLGVGALYQLSRTNLCVTLNRLRPCCISMGYCSPGSKILSFRERDIGSSIAAIISLVIQAANVGLLARPAEGGPTNSIGIIYFGIWFGFALAFELCLRYLEFYTSASDGPGNNKYRRKGTGQTAYGKHDSADDGTMSTTTMLEDTSIGTSGIEYGHDELAQYSQSFDSSYATMPQNSKCSPSKHMVLRGDASLDHEEEDSSYRIEQLPSRPHVFSYTLSFHNQPLKTQGRRPSVTKQSDVDQCRTPVNPPPGNLNFRGAGKEDFSARNATVKPVEPLSRALKETPVATQLAPAAAKIRRPQEERTSTSEKSSSKGPSVTMASLTTKKSTSTTDCPLTVDNDVDTDSNVLSPQHDAGVLHSIRRPDPPKKARSSKKRSSTKSSRSHKKGTSVLSPGNLLNSSSVNGERISEYSQPSAKSRKTTSSVIASTKSSLRSESKIRQDHDVEQGVSVPSTNRRNRISVNGERIPRQSQPSAKSRKTMSSAVASTKSRLRSDSNIRPDHPVQQGGSVSSANRLNSSSDQINRHSQPSAKSRKTTSSVVASAKSSLRSDSNIQQDHCVKQGVAVSSTNRLANGERIPGYSQPNMKSRKTTSSVIASTKASLRSGSTIQKDHGVDQGVSVLSANRLYSSSSHNDKRIPRHSQPSAKSRKTSSSVIASTKSNLHSNSNIQQDHDVEQGVSVASANRPNRISVDGEQIPRYSQPSAKTRKTTSSAVVSTKPRQYSKSNIRKDRYVERGVSVSSDNLQGSNVLSIEDPSKTLAGSRRRVSDASSLILGDSKESDLTPPLIISDRSVNDVQSSLSSLSKNSGPANHGNIIGAMCMQQEDLERWTL